MKIYGFYDGEEVVYFASKGEAIKEATETHEHEIVVEKNHVAEDPSERNYIHPGPIVVKAYEVDKLNRRTVVALLNDSQWALAIDTVKVVHSKPPK